MPDTYQGLIMAEFDKANFILIFLSVFVPIVGIVLYFVKKDLEPNAAKTYLGCAIAGIVIGLVVTFSIN